MVSFESAAVDAWDYPRPGSGIVVLVDHAAAHGLSVGRALAGTGLAGAPDGEVTAAQELRVVRNVRSALGEVGAAVGARYRASTFGAFDYALLTSPTVLDAMNLALRFLDLSHAFVIPRATVVGSRVRIVLDGADLPADVRRFLVERDTAAIRAVLGELVPGGVPTQLERVRPEGSGEARTIWLDAEHLDRPLERSNPQALAVAEQLCAGVVARRRERTGLPAEVRVLITQHLASGAPMPVVATALGLSERTLRRRLGAAGTSYRTLVEEVRQALAAELLAGGRLSVAELAVRLGYAEATSFILAHRRWTGATPGSRAARGD